MKRVMMCALALVSLANVSKAQKSDEKGFYLKAAGGYFFSVSPGQFPNVGPYAPHQIIQTVNSSTGAVTTVSDKVLTGSYGEGVRGGLSVGYSFNRYMAVELTANYFHSKKNLMTEQFANDPSNGKVYGDLQSYGHVNAIDLAPSFVLSPGLQGKFNPYVRFGLVVPVWGRLIIETDAYKFQPAGAPYPATIYADVNVHRKEEVKPNATVGFQGALGVNYKLNKRLDLFLETEYRNVPVESKSKEVTDYSEKINLINVTSGTVVGSSSRDLSGLSTAERYTNYQTTITASSNTRTGGTDVQPTYKDNNAPANDFKSYINIGGLGLNLGIKIKI